MEFRILGPLEVVSNGEALDLGGQKQRALLAMLLLHANEVVSSDRLIEALWEERPPETAQKALQVYVSQLRKLLGKERVQTKPPGYLLRVSEDELDLDRCRRLAADGRPAEALALWRGSALAEFSFEPFAQSQIARLEELRLACVEERMAVELDQGCHRELVGELEGLVGEHPLRERLRGQLMLALYRSGRQAEALEAYQDAREALVDELGIEPSRELRDLQQAILNQDRALDLAAALAAEAEPTRGTFVGRERELSALTSGLDDAFAGRGRLFLLVGEPGIGKSRLADELTRHARGRGARVLVGRCWEAGGAPAYWPWVQSMRALVRESEPGTLREQLGDGAVDLAQLLPELRELFPDLGRPPSLESESARFRLFEAATSLLTSAAQARPVVLVLDDLHAADEPSLLLLQFLARELGSCRVLVVGAYRNVDPTPSNPLTAAVAELGREPVSVTVTLAGLDQHDVERFIELLTGETPNHELVRLIHEETQGNPLFMGEIVRLLVQEGRLDNGDASRLIIPQSVRDVIARRLAHLTEECNRVLVLAAVLGREFALDALARVAGATEDELLETLDEAIEARVVSDVPGSPGRLRFAHVLIRDSLYEELPSTRRVRVHRLAANALETLYGAEPRAQLAELAYHTIAGSEFAKGVHYAQQAGDRALTLLAYEEATRLYAMALDALELSDPENEKSRCELLLSLGDAQMRAGQSPPAKQAFLAAAELARRLGLTTELARAAAGYGGRAMWARAGSDDRLVPLLEEGLAALAEDNVELRARLLARLAGALRDEPTRNRRDKLSREAVELARDTGNAAALAYALGGRVASMLAPDSVGECLALSSELRELAEQIGDKELSVSGHIARYLVQMMTGDLSEVESGLAVASGMADQLKQPATLWQVFSSNALLALTAGRLNAAEELVWQAFALGERAQPEMAIPTYRLQRYQLCDFQGRLDEVVPEITDLVSEYPARPAFRCALAHLHARLGQLDIARLEFEQFAVDDFAALPFDMEWLYGMSLLAETCSLVRNTDSANVLYGLLTPWASFNAADPPEGNRGSVSRYLGLLAARMERLEDARQHFEDALVMNGRTGARPWLAHTQHDYARMFCARDRPGDRERAAELESQALATFTELGMNTPEEK